MISGVGRPRGPGGPAPARALTAPCASVPASAVRDAPAGAWLAAASRCAPVQESGEPGAGLPLLRGSNTLGEDVTVGVNCGEQRRGKARMGQA